VCFYNTRKRRAFTASLVMASLPFIGHPPPFTLSLEEEEEEEEEPHTPARTAAVTATTTLTGTTTVTSKTRCRGWLRK
jgi:hypothetical protein